MTVTWIGNKRVETPDTPDAPVKAVLKPAKQKPVDLPVDTEDSTQTIEKE